MTKRELRGAMRALLRALPAEAFIAGGEAATRTLAAQPCWLSASSVCCFLSMPDELETEDLLVAALATGKRLALPHVEQEDLLFRETSSATGPWVVGAFDIREPGPECPAVRFDAVPGPILVLTSGLAFDRAGRRLGRGRGFYDRFLRSLRGARADVTAVGLGLPSQLVEMVPVDDGDERLDGLCLAGDFLVCAR